MEVPQVTLRFTIDKIASRNSFISKVFDVRGLQWQIKVTQEMEMLGVYLESRNKDATSWSCMAWCRIQLISSSRQPYEKSFKSPREYSAKRLSYGIKNFISLNDLYDPAKRYIDNNSIVLEVKVKANLPAILSKSVIEKTTCIRLTIDNITNSYGFISPSTDIRGIPWRVKVFFRKVDSKSVMAVMLNCAYRDTPNWSCKASAIIRLRSFDPDKPSYQCQFSKMHKFTSTAASQGFKNFITRKKLLDEGKQFVRDGSIRLEIEMTVEKPNGTARKRTVECPICLENLLEKNTKTTECGHVFCQYCIERSLTVKSFCPTCKVPLHLSDTFMLYWP